MTNPWLEEAYQRFLRAQRRVAVAAALLQSIDLDLLEGFYQRASSPQAVAAGETNLQYLPALESWTETIAAARALRDSIHFDANTLETLEKLIGSISPAI